METEDAGARIDLQMGEWKPALEIMRSKTDRRLGGTHGAHWSEIEQLRREFQGLRIKKVATWHAPIEQREEAKSHFAEMWSDWVARARAAQRMLSE